MVSTVSPLSVLAALVLGGVLLLWVRYSSAGWRGVTKSGARLPKGSFGWPIIGETIELGKNPLLYAHSHVKRYGRIFKSSLLLNSTVVGTTPEFCKFILSNPKLFSSGWKGPGPGEVLGPEAFSLKDGPSHMNIKLLLMKAIKAETLRTKVDVLEGIVFQHISSWAKKGTVVGLESTRKIALDTAMYIVLGERDIGRTAEGREILEQFELLHKAISSPPIKLPGSSYNEGFKARARLTTCLKSLIETRQKANIQTDDFLGILLAARDDKAVLKEVKDLSDELIVHNIALIVFAAYDTTAMTLVWILKLMNETPDAFRRLQDEQREILKSKGPHIEGPRLTWEDLREMEYGRKFFQEVQRFVSLNPFLPRKANQDIEYEGHLIPKGWNVSAIASYIHRNPELYVDPETFNPDRFNVTPKPFTYVPFGGGTHMCPGIELANTTSLSLIHHFTTTFKHERTGPDLGVEYHFSLLPIGGYPINVRRRSEADE